MDLALLRAINIIDCAVLNPVSNDLFSIEKDSPDWLSLLIVGCFDPLVKVTIESSPFLADFIVDARPVWNSREAGKISSGIWSESTANSDMHFEATAVRADNGSCYLLIENVDAQYQKQHVILQQAREVLIEHDKIISEHEYIKQRLNDCLSSAKNRAFDLPTIGQTFYHLETGVVVTSASDKVLFENESAMALLNSSSREETTARLHRILTELELNATRVTELVKRRSSWQGELLWHNYASAGRWLQVTIHPVVDDDGVHTNWVYVLSEISNLKNDNANLPPQISSDSLTALPGRRYFTVQLRKTCGQERPFYLINVDIKGFKHINNLYGYRVGDELLKKLAKRLEKTVGDSGFAARIASNEFALIVAADNNESPDSALLIAESLKVTLSQPYDVNHDHNISVNVCVGIAKYPHHGRAADELMRNCGLALYYAKYDETSGVCQFNEELQRLSNARYQLEDDLRKAIDTGELTVYLQPIIDLNTRKVVKCEALSRWQRADGTFVSPDVFIPVAEQSGLIIKLGNWLINEVCTILQRFSALEIDIGIGINVSGIQVADAKNIDDILACIESYKLPPNKLSFELTESVLVHNYKSVSKMLAKLRLLGIVVSIDDFGTGFSSLSYLKYLSIDELKIDKSFIQDINPMGGDDNVIVIAIIALAKSLNLRVIAEGVETQVQQDFVTQHECDLAQGYLYSKPLPVNVFCQWYRDRTT